KGTDFALYKQSTIRRRILRRMALARIERVEDYAEYVAQHPQEITVLYEDLLINVTQFFRDPVAFTALRRRVLPALFKRSKQGTRVRIWVPGCSTGEEVYSIAIVASEYLGDRARPDVVQIFGTDLSDGVIERARAGRYPASIAEDVSAERLRRYFV